MRNIVILSAAVIAMCGVQASAQTKPAPVQAGGICTKLMDNYENASRKMAANLASSLTDNSAPRATLREMEDSNELAKAAIALDLMRDNRCALPKHVPDASRYAMAALGCSSARLSAKPGDKPEACKRELWKPETD